MLEAEEQSQENWHTVVQAEEGSGSSLSLHEGKVGLEEESIVIASNEAIPTSECQSVDGSSHSFGYGRTWW